MISRVVILVMLIGKAWQVWSGFPPPERPSPAKELPPGDALEYALWDEGGGGGGAVAVVDLGDGQRWLRALHLASRAPAILWKAPHQPVRGSAPPWLERQCGYILAARKRERLHDFLVKDTRAPVPDAGYAYPDNKPHRNLQLKSTAPIVLSLSEPSSSNTKQEDIRTLKILDALASHHQSFRGFLLQETEPENWELFWLKFPKTTKPKNTKRHLDGTQAAKMAAQAWHMSHYFGRSVDIVYPVSFAYQSTQVDVNGIIIDIVGNGYALLEELQRQLNIQWRLSPFFNCKETPTCWGYNRLKILKALLQEKVAFIPMNSPLPPHFTKVFSLLPASLTHMDQIVVVPHASLLPAWTLPLRAFDATLWGALLGTASVYALAWRVVAGESLAASAAAALRAFSSCGGAPQDRVRATPQRLQLAGALVASAIVVATLYQGRLVTLTTVPERGAETDTWTQLVASELPVKTLSKYVDFMGEEVILPSGACLTVRPMNQVQLRFALVRGRRFGWWVTQEVWRDLSSCAPRLTQLMRPMRDAVIPKYSSMLARMNWPWVDAVNEQILLYQGVGLITKWKEDYERAMKLYARLGGDIWARTLDPVRPDLLGPRVLELENVVPHFELLGAGASTGDVSLCVGVLQNHA